MDDDLEEFSHFLKLMLAQQEGDDESVSLLAASSKAGK